MHPTHVRLHGVYHMHCLHNYLSDSPISLWYKFIDHWSTTRSFKFESGTFYLATSSSAQVRIVIVMIVLLIHCKLILHVFTHYSSLPQQCLQTDPFFLESSLQSSLAVWRRAINSVTLSASRHVAIPSTPGFVPPATAVPLIPPSPNACASMPVATHSYLNIELSATDVSAILHSPQLCAGMHVPTPSLVTSVPFAIGADSHHCNFRSHIVNLRKCSIYM